MERCSHLEKFCVSAHFSKLFAKSLLCKVFWSKMISPVLYTSYILMRHMHVHSIHAHAYMYTYTRIHILSWRELSIYFGSGIRVVKDAYMGSNQLDCRKIVQFGLSTNQIAKFAHLHIHEAYTWPFWSK